MLYPTTQRHIELEAAFPDVGSYGLKNLLFREALSACIPIPENTGVLNSRKPFSNDILASP
jgi:hypothetical protein